MENKKEIGQQIKLLRRWLDLSQVEFGKRIGVSITTIWFWEKGERIPPASKIEKIEDVFDVTLNSIVELKLIME